MAREVLAVVGLGYVGLPLAVAFSQVRRVIGFDLSQARVKQLLGGNDVTGEVSTEALLGSSQLTCTADPELLRGADIFIVTVPTPITKDKQPDLTFLENACKQIGRFLSAGNLVIFESTVYPGVTEEFCAPLLRKYSGLSWDGVSQVRGRDAKGFYLGYSPERINPGDKTRGFEDIVKVVSGCCPESTESIISLYAEVVHAGVYVAPDIRTAEAAKVIENAQRDINIAFMNELSTIFNRLDIDTREVLKAARTKWNFLDFAPGLVGGHCIGVDPYYLVHKARVSGYEPRLINESRKLNDDMPESVASYLMRSIISKPYKRTQKIGVLGLTFKPNCPDLRNSKVIELVDLLVSWGNQVFVEDSLVNEDLVPQRIREMWLPMESWDKLDAVVLAVLHEDYKVLDTESVLALLSSDGPKALLDLSMTFSRNECVACGIDLLQL